MLKSIRKISYTLEMCTIYFFEIVYFVYFLRDGVKYSLTYTIKY